jgi:hypothetical protein
MQVLYKAAQLLACMKLAAYMSLLLTKAEKSGPAK